MNNAQCRRLRREVVGTLSGEVLEVGFGSGLNLPFYPRAVTRILAVDPARVGRRLAAKRLAACPIPVEFAGLDGEQLELDDDQVDAVLSTWTLCTIPDAARALREIRRVLRPGGRFHFVEHGLAPDARVARWQRRLSGLWQRVAGGCHLDREIEVLVREAGFAPQSLDRFYLRGPRIFSYHYQGVAVAADARRRSGGEAPPPPRESG